MARNTARQHQAPTPEPEPQNPETDPEAPADQMQLENEPLPEEFSAAVRSEFDIGSEDIPRLEDQKTYLVRDLLALTSPRTHEMKGSDGRMHAYVFPNHHTDINVPLEHALRFAAIVDGFEVRNAMGQVLKPRRTMAGGQAYGLQPNETIAVFDELSTEALVRRVVKIARSQRVRDHAINAPREELIEFLMATPEEQVVGDAPQPTGTPPRTPLVDSDEEYAGAEV